MKGEKIAVIVIGKHGAGKSKTIREYLKPMLGITKDAHKFTLEDERTGYVLSQTFEERNEPPEIIPETLRKYENYDILILPVRPKEDEVSFYEEVKKSLIELGFKVKEVEIEKGKEESYYKSKAEEIFNLIEN